MLASTLNGLFIAGASVMMANTIRQLYKDKAVKGVTVVAQWYFFAWTLFSIYFFYTVEATASLWAEVVLSVLSLTYAYLLMYYKRLDKDNKPS